MSLHWHDVDNDDDSDDYNDDDDNEESCEGMTQLASGGKA